MNEEKESWELAYESTKKQIDMWKQILKEQRENE